MKVEQKNKQFRPITITLENIQEYDDICSALHIASSCGYNLEACSRIENLYKQISVPRKFGSE